MTDTWSSETVTSQVIQHHLKLTWSFQLTSLCWCRKTQKEPFPVCQTVMSSASLINSPNKWEQMMWQAAKSKHNTQLGFIPGVFYAKTIHGSVVWKRTDMRIRLKKCEKAADAQIRTLKAGELLLKSTLKAVKPVWGAQNFYILLYNIKKVWGSALNLLREMFKSDLVRLTSSGLTHDRMESMLLMIFRILKANVHVWCHSSKEISSTSGITAHKKIMRP